MHIPHRRFAVLVIIAAAALTACGGGGGDPATTATNGQATPAGAATLVTTAPTPTYPAASEELDALEYLNSARLACGFGALAQSPQLDAAAAGHAAWSITNSSAGGHFQAIGTPGFTGLAPVDRARAAGYLAQAQGYRVSESIAYSTGPDNLAGFGTRAVRGLLNAPYHAVDLLDGYREVGVSIQASQDGTRRFAVLNPAHKNTGPQLLAGADVVTYPCEGSKGIVFELRGESPNPVPGRDLAAQPLGSSIMIAVRQGQQLAITAATLTHVSTGQQIPIRAPVTSQNDQHRLLESHQAFISADGPLQPSSQYQATVTGTNAGRPWSRTFTFTTSQDARL